MPGARTKRPPQRRKQRVDQPTTAPEPSSNGSHTPQTNDGAAAGVVISVPAGTPQESARPGARTQPNSGPKHTFVVEAASWQVQRFNIEAADLRTALARAEARIDLPRQIISISRA